MKKIAIIVTILLGFFCQAAYSGVTERVLVSADKDV